jgi:phosphohistidine phosphatase SixA
MMRRRSVLLLPVCLPFAAARAEGDPWRLLQEPGAIILFRHATAPGTGDPAGFVLGDCSTQRNLDDRGKAEARALGAAFRQHGITVGRVLSSQWCRAKETAELAFPGLPVEEPAFNSFFGNRADEPAATERAQQIIGEWRGPGVLVVVTHQVNISALTGVAPASGEGIIVRNGQAELEVLGRLPSSQYR